MISTSGVIRVTFLTGVRNGTAAASLPATGFQARWYQTTEVLDFSNIPAVTYTRPTGNFSDGYDAPNQDYPAGITKTWIIAPPAARTLTLDISGVGLSALGDVITAAQCYDAACSSLYLSEPTNIYNNQLFTSSTGIAKIQLISRTRLVKGGCTGFQASYTSDAPEDPYTSTSTTYTSRTGSFSDGYPGYYPQFSYKSWIIAPATAVSATLHLTEVKLSGFSDYLMVKFCTDVFCNQFEQVFYANFPNDYTSSTGVIQLELFTYERWSIAYDDGFKATWDSELELTGNATYDQVVTYTALSGSLSDGWREDYPMNVMRTWYIVKPNVSLVILFTTVSLPGSRDYVTAEACETTECAGAEKLQVYSDYTSLQADTGIIKVTFASFERHPVFGCEGFDLGCGGFQAIWFPLDSGSGGGGGPGSGGGGGQDDAPPRTVDKPLPSVCNNMLLAAEEIWVNLETSIMPTNSTGIPEFFPVCM
jgi:hypothetical protein